MRKVGIKVLKNRLSEYVRLAAAGETVQITDRGRVVVELRAPSPLALAEFEQRLVERLQREGVLTPATAPSDDPLPRHPSVPFDQLMREIAADREDR